MSGFGAPWPPAALVSHPRCGIYFLGDAANCKTTIAALPSRLASVRPWTESALLAQLRDF